VTLLGFHFKRVADRIDERCYPVFFEVGFSIHRMADYRGDRRPLVLSLKLGRTWWTATR
jgi:hypothetical protein